MSSDSVSESDNEELSVPAVIEYRSLGNGTAIVSG